MAAEAWEDFGFRFGPFEVGFSGLGQFIKHTRTDTSHILRIRIHPEVKKKEIKACLMRPGLLEIEWPRAKSEESPVEWGTPGERAMRQETGMLGSTGGPRGTTVDLLQRFRLALLLVLVLIGVGALGYVWLEGMTLLDALYMTVITITAVGFGEVHPLSPAGRLFTIGLILASVGLGFYASGTGVELLLGEHLWHLVGRRRMARLIEQLRDHYVICGYGRMGRQTAADFAQAGVPFVVIEVNPAVTAELEGQQRPTIRGDATQDRTLLAASVECARGLLAVLDRDADNLIVVLSTKALNPGLLAVARATSPEVEEKLRRAGADRVVSPYVIGGRRIALTVLRPVVGEVLHTITFEEATGTIDESGPATARLSSATPWPRLSCAHAGASRCWL